MPVRIEEKAQVHILLENIDTILLDCDGVIWLGNTILPGAIETIQQLRLNQKLYFITNSSVKSRQSMQIKFAQLGLFVDIKEIICSSFLSAVYLGKHMKPGKVYVIGRQGILEELSLMNIPALGGPV
jgi:HAD superfamily hydrolase (TIGR01450 family)